ncbi:cyclic pyranopterin monophosphate synthase MoaC [Crateriforma conspicua]|uniref:cyclic pyranopterin monophosphate synthase n=1 Tax=Crateriforma conspicua TaxID=2527996 RepID=A0A5C5Y170_9PLAN|nr:cyclic pyranopterin monophosphate synthase MoaC [Crateriforma conspicua]TWT69496.1 Cyclic pyranopterin monophosphate synthase accessory protein [Crateriforma conspicua]
MSHFSPDGDPRMVDVSAKPPTVRTATARGVITMSTATADRIRNADTAKGDVVTVAQLAAIQSAKRTPDLIPLCHSIAVESVDVTFQWSGTETSDGDRLVRLVCDATVKTSGKTGVEMEALTAVSVGCLTVYDMAKSIERGMTIGPIWLIHKSGGKSGDYHAPPRDPRTP